MFFSSSSAVVSLRNFLGGEEECSSAVLPLNHFYRKIVSPSYSRVVVVVVVVSHIQRIGCQPEKTTLHGGQSRSWSAEQGKENKRKSLAAYPPPHPPHCSFGENK